MSDTLSLPFTAAGARRRAFRAAVSRALKSCWTGLERAGQQRAERELALFIERHGDQHPEIAARLRDPQRRIFF